MSDGLVKGKKMELNVLFDVVRIEIHCGDDYEAQVLFDDLAQRLQAGEVVSLWQGRSPLPPHQTQADSK